MSEYVQTLDDMERDYEGYVVPCPVCSEDKDWTPRIFVGDGKCYECGTEYSVEITWSVDDE